MAHLCNITRPALFVILTLQNKSTKPLQQFCFRRVGHRMLCNLPVSFCQHQRPCQEVLLEEGLQRQLSLLTRYVHVALHLQGENVSKVAKKVKSVKFCLVPFCHFVKHSKF